MKPSRARHRVRWAVVGVVTAAVIITVVSGVMVPAVATLKPEPPPDLNAVIGNLRNWLVGLLVALATLALTFGGIRYLLAGGDPGEVGKAKETLKYAAVGYGVAALAPILVTVLQKIVGA